MPNKESIYPEFMPSAYNRAGSWSRLDQLLAYMKAHSSVTILDVRDGLRHAKDRERLFDRTDTHWNERGSWAAYGRIMEILTGWFPGMKAIPRREFLDVSRTTPGGDLAKMLGVPELMLEEHLQLQRLTPFRSRKTNGSHSRRGRGVRPTGSISPWNRRTSRCPGRSSSGTPLCRLSSRSYPNTSAVSSSSGTMSSTTALVERERPNVVIQEMVEAIANGTVAPVDF